MGSRLAISQSERRFYVRVGLQLKGARESRGLSQIDVADVVGLTNSMIGYVERGRTRASLFLLVRWCAFLELDLAQLLAQAVVPEEKP